MAVRRSPAGSGWTAALGSWARQALHEAPAQPLLDEALPQFEKTLILAALDHARGRKQDAAKLLGWGRNTLARKMKDLGLEN